jgi:hypothetical protein
MIPNLTETMSARIFVTLALYLSFTYFPIQAEEYQPVTTQYLDYDIDELEFKLTPLTLEESEIEATAWTSILKKHVSLVSEAEILLSKKQKQIKSAETIADMSSSRTELLEQERKSKADKKELKAEFKRLLAEVDNLTDNKKYYMNIL